MKKYDLMWHCISQVLDWKQMLQETKQLRRVIKMLLKICMQGVEKLTIHMQNAGCQGVLLSCKMKRGRGSRGLRKKLVIGRGTSRWGYCLRWKNRDMDNLWPRGQGTWGTFSGCVTFNSVSLSLS